MQRREGWKEGKKRTHDSQEDTLSQIYFDNPQSHKARNVYLSVKMKGLFMLCSTSNNLKSMLVRVYL